MGMNQMGADGMSIQEAITLVVNQGFAVAVAFYSLTRLERTMKDNTSVMTKLVAKLDRDYRDSEDDNK